MTAMATKAPVVLVKITPCWVPSGTFHQHRGAREGMEGGEGWGPGPAGEGERGG